MKEGFIVEKKMQPLLPLRIVIHWCQKMETEEADTCRTHVGRRVSCILDMVKVNQCLVNSN